MTTPVYPFLGLLTMGGTIQGPVDGPPEDPPPPDDPPPTPGWSLTGRDPLYLNESQVDAWIQMKDENHPWYTQGILYDATNGGNGNDGTAAAWMYQVTGNAAWASAAWSVVSTWVGGTRTTLTGDGVRESFVNKCYIVDILWPWLDAGQRASVCTHMEECVEFAFANGTLPYKGGMSLGDSDRITGCYFGVMLWNAFNEPENTLYGTLTNRVCLATGVSMGGFTATGANGATYRNIVNRLYTVNAVGGEWIESSEYNMGTVRFNMLGWKGCLNAYGTDNFPEIAAWLPDGARWAVAEITPDLLDMNQWSDDQNPRAWQSRMWNCWPALAMFASLNPTDTEGGHFCSTLANTLPTMYPTQTWAGSLARKGYLLANPYVTQRPLSEFHQATQAPGVGHMIVRHGNDMAILCSPPRRENHHGLVQNASFKLYRGGKWALNTPIGYQPGWSDSSYTVNTLLFAGLPYPMTTVARVESTMGADYWVQAFRTTGQYDTTVYNPPPAFVTGDQLRRMVYWRDEATGYDIFVIRDDTNLVNPTSLPLYSQYRDTDEAIINAAITRTGGSLKEWKIHASVAPTLDSGTGIWSWPIAGTVDTAYVAPLSPTLTATVYNESTELGFAAGIKASERKYQLRFHPSTVQAIDTFVVVVMVGTGARPAINYTDVNTVEIAGRTVTFSGQTASISAAP